MFTVRTDPVAVGTVPYAWDVPSTYQCTWYSFYRAQEAGFTPPCYYDRATRTGSYTNAKDWLANFCEPWEVKGADYIPVAGDIAVFDGTYGHVQFMETDTMFSEYASGDPNSFKNGTFAKKSNLLGFLHYPYNSLNPVPRDTSVDQIQTTDDSLRIRTEPTLAGEIVGHVGLGYYNVLERVSANKEDRLQVPGLEYWYKLAEDRWCANITTIWLPENSSEIIRRFEADSKELINLIKEKDDRINKLEDKIARIKAICEE